MRPVAFVAAALTFVCLVLGMPLAAIAAPAVIGPPPDAKTRTVVVQTGLTQADVNAALARQKKANDQESAKLESRITELKATASSKDEEIAALASLSESIRADYTKAFSSQQSQLDKIEELTAKNHELAAAANGTRPAFARDWLDWAALAAGLLLGGLIGLRLGIRRGEDRATGAGIPANVAAWWGEPEGPQEVPKPT